MTKDEIKKGLKANKIKQKDLAKSVGITSQHLCNMLSGKYVMNESMYKRIIFWYDRLCEHKRNANTKK